ncbi:aspartate ammonia-lyase [Tropicibacter sp. R16_0]|uniref:aspartate ammonia-lyase n=1 Tax=Tropicibacter sp. R16_0 TaxID=2821102 RepID=UPI001ADB168B|nr:aspartate ammonia-lyase [Tropicibacter sp. R16_0]MBO9451968.1 aspartate ammonia-lyase [Tropicibacter sp. R16_0]
MAQVRTETDSIGGIELPASCLYGIQTERARQNFPITGVRLSQFPSLVSALAMVKSAAARANAEIGALDTHKAHAIVGVCDDIIAGHHHAHFVVDMIQGGAGTSTNMNANEVIANLALVNLGHAPGSYDHLHPNDDVNHGQSTNDVYPTAVRLAVLSHAAPLCEALARLKAAFEDKASEFAGIAKVGRTQLQDAVPMSLGAEFRSFAVTLGEDIDRIHEIGRLLTEINLGGTAIGTRVNAEAGYDTRAVAHLAKISGFDLKQASDLIEASSDLGGFVTFSGILKRVAVKLSKICNDLRLLSSGPRAGFGEIILPPVQAGSSIMPGKVNPVIPEVVNQVCYQVIGNDLTVTMAAEAGQLQLNAMEPVVAYNLLNSLTILTNAIDVLTDKCVTGIQADADRCAALLDHSLVLVTALAPHIGYDAAAKIAKQALVSGCSIRQVAVESGILPNEQLTELLSPDAMLGQGTPKDFNTGECDEGTCACQARD